MLLRVLLANLHSSQTHLPIIECAARAAGSGARWLPPAEPDKVNSKPVCKDQLCFSSMEYLRIGLQACMRVLLHRSAASFAASPSDPTRVTQHIVDTASHQILLNIFCVP